LDDNLDDDDDDDGDYDTESIGKENQELFECQAIRFQIETISKRAKGAGPPNDSSSDNEYDADDDDN